MILIKFTPTAKTSEVTVTTETHECNLCQAVQQPILYLISISQAITFYLCEPCRLRLLAQLGQVDDPTNLLCKLVQTHNKEDVKE